MSVPTALFTGFPGFLGTAVSPRVFAGAPSCRSSAWCNRRSAARRGAELVEVWHLAAAYDLAVTREVGLRVNVAGTGNVLDVASAAPNLTRVHYVSTCHVSDRHPGLFGEDELVVGQSFNNHYESTKFLAEHLVRQRMADGLPVTIYRPAIVVGDGTTGVTEKYDGAYFLIQWVLRQPRVAYVPLVADPHTVRFTVVPGDVVVRAIDELSALAHTVGQTHALADPDPPTIAELLDILAETARRRIVTTRVAALPGQGRHRARTAPRPAHARPRRGGRLPRPPHRVQHGERDSGARGDRVRCPAVRFVRRAARRLCRASAWRVDHEGVTSPGPMPATTRSR